MVERSRLAVRLDWAGVVIVAPGRPLFVCPSLFVGDFLQAQHRCPFSGFLLLQAQPLVWPKFGLAAPLGAVVMRR